MKEHRFRYKGHLVLLTLHSLVLIACAEVPPKSIPPEMLMRRIYLSHTSLVEAASNISGDVYLLTIRMRSQQSGNIPTMISVERGSEQFLIPRSLFKNQYGQATATHLFVIDADHIGFVLTCGDGEHAKNCLYRIHMKKQVVRREDWSPFGKLESLSGDLPLERVKMGNSVRQQKPTK